MRKYWQVFKTSWQESFVYRLNFIMRRVRSILLLLTVYFLWRAVFQNNQIIFGYDQAKILTYVLGTSILRAIVLSSRTAEVGEEISQGNLSLYLLRPISYLKYWFSRDLSEKALNILFSLGELTLLFFLLRPPFLLQTNPLLLLFFALSLLLALLLYFYLDFSLGLIVFWMPESVWAPRFLFIIILEFLAGGLFPLDILPSGVFNTLQILPFSYLLFFPLNIYLGKIEIEGIMAGLTIGVAWLIIMYEVGQLLWAKGLRLYSAEGR